MTKFLETFLNRLIDFLNFGRLITIVVPGVIVSFCVLMFAGQLLAPLRPAQTAAKEQAADTKIAEQHATSANAAKMEKSDKQEKTPANQTPANPVKIDKHSLFQAQVKIDFKRANSHIFIIVFFTIVLGILLYELSFGVLSWFPLPLLIKKPGAFWKFGFRCVGADTEKNYGLCRYDSVADAEAKPSNKFKFLKVKEAVDLEYFAPFLKEKFSGDENYFDFLITEYYRFIEFSVIMPLAIFTSALVGTAYWLLFCLRNSCWFLNGTLLFFLLTMVLAILFVFFISNKIWLDYQKSKSDLIKGVSDLMAKGMQLK